jgi:hypothetical protein
VIALAVTVALCVIVGSVLRSKGLLEEKKSKEGRDWLEKFVHGDPQEMAVAKEKLKTMLDGWLFGDKPSKFQEEHDDIDLSVIEMGMYVLLKYEIGAERFSHPYYEFAVTLVFKSEGGTEIRDQKRFRVTGPEESEFPKKWKIVELL